MKKYIALIAVAVILVVTGCAQLEKVALTPPAMEPYTNSAGNVVLIPQVQPNPAAVSAVQNAQGTGTLFGQPVSTVVNIVGGALLAGLAWFARSKNELAKLKAEEANANAEEAKANKSALATIVAGVEQGGDDKTKKAVFTIATANGTQPLIESVVNPTAAR